MINRFMMKCYYFKDNCACPFYDTFVSTEYESKCQIVRTSWQKSNTTWHRFLRKPWDTNTSFIYTLHMNCLLVGVYFR